MPICQPIPCTSFSSGSSLVNPELGRYAILLGPAAVFLILSWDAMLISLVAHDVEVFRKPILVCIFPYDTCTSIAQVHHSWCCYTLGGILIRGGTATPRLYR